MRICVLGGGISGLSIGYLLKKNLVQYPVHINILESQTRPGGCIFSRRFDDYLVEWGPNGFLNNEPATFNLIKDLEIEHRLLRSNDCARKRYIYKHQFLHKLPESPPEFIKSGILSPVGKFRFLLEPFIPAKRTNDEETVAEFVKRRLGREPVRTMFDPFVSGVFAGDVNKLSVQNAIKTFYELETEYGSIIRGMLKRVRQRKKQGMQSSSGQVTESKNPMKSVLYSFDEGMNVIIDALQHSLKQELSCDSVVESVRSQGNGMFSVHYLKNGEPAILQDTDIVVSAIPAVNGNVFHKLDPLLHSTMEQIHAASVVVVAFGYNKEDIPDIPEGFGYLIPRAENLRILGTLFSSTIFSNRAGAGKVLLTTMIGGATDTQAIQMDDDELMDTVLKNLQQTLGISRRPEFSRIIRCQPGIPQYEVGHNTRLNKIIQYSRKFPGLFFSGNSFRGISTNDCIRNAYLLSDEIAGFIQSHLQ